MIGEGASNNYKFDPVLLIIILIIGICAILNLASSTRSAGVTILWVKQLLWFLAGFLIFGLIVYFTDERKLKILIYLLYGVNVLLLILIIVAGKGPGVKRWLDLGIFKVQPSELAKVTTVGIVAITAEKILARSNNINLKHVLSISIPVLLPSFLVAVQPDLGTAVTILIISGALVLLCGVERKTIILLISCIIVAAPISWKFFLKDYQKKRLVTFLNPEKDPLGSGYQSLQSKISVGSGGLWGKGYMKGTQTRLKFLPEQHTDFAFSVWAEEWGFAGSLLVLALYLALIMYFLEIASRAKTVFSYLMAASVSIYFTVHVLFNLGMVTGIFPVVGLPLPLFSYGGSAVVSTFTLCGLAYSAYVNEPFI